MNPTPLQLQILRALDVPKSTGNVAAAINEQRRLTVATLYGLMGEGWVSADEPDTACPWHRTQAGTEALAGITALPIDPADERAASAFEEPEA